MSPLFSDLLRLKNVPGARVCQEITLDTMLGAAGEDFKGSYGPDGLKFVVRKSATVAAHGALAHSKASSLGHSLQSDQNGQNSKTLIGRRLSLPGQEE